jgi:hypothetical protein
MVGQKVFTRVFDGCAGDDASLADLTKAANLFHAGATVTRP